MNVSRENRRIEIAALRDSEFSYCGEHAKTVRNLVNYLCNSLEQAEAERDALAQVLKEDSVNCPDGSSNYCQGFMDGDKDCKLCWLEWAQQEASKGEDPR